MITHPNKRGKISSARLKINFLSLKIVPSGFRAEWDAECGNVHFQNDLFIFSRPKVNRQSRRCCRPMIEISNLDAGKLHVVTADRNTFCKGEYCEAPAHCLLTVAVLSVSR